MSIYEQVDFLILILWYFIVYSASNSAQHASLLGIKNWVLLFLLLDYPVGAIQLHIIFYKIIYLYVYFSNLLFAWLHHDGI